MSISYILGMGNLRKRKIKGYILLESILALGVFAMIATLLLGQITVNRRAQVKNWQEQELLQVSQMALQTGQEKLSLNGQEVWVKRSATEILMTTRQGELVHVVKK